MRELLKALSELETQLINTYGISLNEAMVLCSIGGETVAANVQELHVLSMHLVEQLNNP